MENEYHKILVCLKNHKMACLALKPTALIPTEEILYLSDLLKNKTYNELNLDKILENSDIKKIAEPFFKLSQKTVEIGTRILIDAEQSNLQPGVDLLAMYLMNNFNRNSKAYVYNTYQLYLKDSPMRLKNHKTWLAAKNRRFAAKLVRGAYLSYETASQKSSHTNYTVCSSKEQVDSNFNEVIQELIAEGKSSLVVATHNKKSLDILQNLLERKFDFKSVEYAYLMGFGSKFTVKDQDLRCLEYVPYGPSEVKIPYLLRRLEENISIFQDTNKK